MDDLEPRGVPEADSHEGGLLLGWSVSSVPNRTGIPSSHAPCPSRSVADSPIPWPSPASRPPDSPSFLPPRLLRRGLHAPVWLSGSLAPLPSGRKCGMGMDRRGGFGGERGGLYRGIRRPLTDNPCPSSCRIPLTGTKTWIKLGFPRRLRSFSWLFGGRVVAISSAGESPRERLSVGTDSPDSDEHNTRGVG